MTCARCESPAGPSGYCRACLSVPSVCKALGIPLYHEHENDTVRVYRSRKSLADAPKCPNHPPGEYVPATHRMGAREYCLQCAEKLGARRHVRRCSDCGRIGHNTRTCPETRRHP